MPSVVSLTPAPVIDRTYFVDSFDTGKVNRAMEIEEFLSGKGINVSRTLRVAGVPTSAVLPVGREDEQLLFRTPFPHILRILPVPGRMRVNTAIIESEGRTTNVNQKAVPLRASDWADVVEMTLQEINTLNADWLVVSGSVPKLQESGEKVDFTELFEKARALGTRVAVDTSGSSLSKWAGSGLVNCIKPNADEMATLVKRELNTVGDVLDATREVIANTGLEVVLVSMGSDGAMAVSAQEAWWGKAKAPQVVNTTGAGDASLAGFLGHSIATGKRKGQGETSDGLPELDLRTGLSKAVVYGAMAVSVPTTILNSFEGAPEPEIGKPVPEQKLSERTKFFNTPSA